MKLSELAELDTSSSMTATSNFVSQAPVVLCNCTKATSFGLSDLKQTSEQLYTQFELDLNR